MLHYCPKRHQRLLAVIGVRIYEVQFSFYYDSLARLIFLNRTKLERSQPSSEKVSGKRETWCTNHEERFSYKSLRGTKNEGLRSTIKYLLFYLFITSTVR